jgi:hypothetical protein
VGQICARHVYVLPACCVQQAGQRRQRNWTDSLCPNAKYKILHKVFGCTTAACKSKIIFEGTVRYKSPRPWGQSLPVGTSEIQIPARVGAVSGKYLARRESNCAQTDLGPQCRPHLGEDYLCSGLAAIELTGAVAIKPCGTNTAERAWAGAIAAGLCTALYGRPKRTRGHGRRRDFRLRFWRFSRFALGWQASCDIAWNPLEQPSSASLADLNLTNLLPPRLPAAPRGTPSRSRQIRQIRGCRI